MFTIYIAKNYLPLLQQIADWLKKVDLVGTLYSIGVKQYCQPLYCVLR